MRTGNQASQLALRFVCYGVLAFWLLLVTFLGAMVLALGKRRAELVVLAEGATDHRRILAEYSPYLLDQMMGVLTSSTLIAYLFYTISTDTVAKFGALLGKPTMELFAAEAAERAERHGSSGVTRIGMPARQPPSLVIALEVEVAGRCVEAGMVDSQVDCVLAIAVPRPANHFLPPFGTETDLALQLVAVGHLVFPSGREIERNAAGNGKQHGDHRGTATTT